jgi:hypothetical protein
MDSLIGAALRETGLSAPAAATAAAAATSGTRPLTAETRPSTTASAARRAEISATIRALRDIPARDR